MKGRFLLVEWPELVTRPVHLLIPLLGWNLSFHSQGFARLSLRSAENCTLYVFSRHHPWARCWRLRESPPDTFCVDSLPDDYARRLLALSVQPPPRLRTPSASPAHLCTTPSVQPTSAPTSALHYTPVWPSSWWMLVTPPIPLFLPSPHGVKWLCIEALSSVDYWKLVLLMCIGCVVFHSQCASSDAHSVYNSRMRRALIVPYAVCSQCLWWSTWCH